MEYNLPNENLIKGSDEESIKLNELIKEKGMRETLKEVTEDSLNKSITEKVEKVYIEL